MTEALAFWAGGALVIVLAGTAIGTMARCGWHDVAVAFRMFMQLGTSDFDKNANRAALARCTPEINRRGRLCAEAPLPPDRSTAKLIQCYLARGSIEDLRDTARVQRSNREIVRARAVRVFDYAGELAPMFGLVGTLFALTQINSASGSGTTEAMMGVVGTAVLSSLYGVLTAHLFCMPLASAIDRRGLREEAARGEIVEWAETQLTRKPVNGDPAVTVTRLSGVA